jgi:hypothetical protein
MHSCLGTVRTHRGCGHLFSYCYPFICICSYCDIVGLQAAHDRPYAYSYMRLIPQLTYDLHRSSGLAGVSFSFLVDMIFAMEGP